MPSDVLGQAVHFLLVAMGMCGGCFRLFLILQIIFSLLRKRHCTFLYTFAVATREGGVDRNITEVWKMLLNSVATREGGVDRNEKCF